MDKSWSPHTKYFHSSILIQWPILVTLWVNFMCNSGCMVSREDFLVLPTSIHKQDQGEWHANISGSSFPGIHPCHPPDPLPLCHLLCQAEFFPLPVLLLLFRMLRLACQPAVECPPLPTPPPFLPRHLAQWCRDPWKTASSLYKQSLHVLRIQCPQVLFFPWKMALIQPTLAISLIQWCKDSLWKESSWPFPLTPTECTASIQCSIKAPLCLKCKKLVFNICV